MPWFKVDDGFTESRKVKAIPRKDRFQALGLWLTAGNFAAKELTDGHIPAYYLEDIFAPEELIEILILVGLWDRDAEGEIWFHDWCEYQPSATAYREKQEKLKAKRSEDGKVAAAKRWHKEPNAAPIGSPIESAMVQNAPEPEPEPEPEPTTPKGVVKRGTKLSEDFEVTGVMRAWATEKHPLVDIDKATANFIDYWLSKPKDNTMLDWTRTWQRWIRSTHPEARTVRANLKEIQREQASEKFLASFSQQPELTANPDWA